MQANMELDCNWILQKEGNILRFSVIIEQKMLDKFLQKQKRLALLAKAMSRKMVLIKMDLDMSSHNIIAKDSVGSVQVTTTGLKSPLIKPTFLLLQEKILSCFTTLCLMRSL